MLGRVQFRLQEVRNVVIYNKLRNFGKIVENSYGSITSNRENISFFENRDNSCVLPQVGKSILI
jgi:hypothetical protein